MNENLTPGHPGADQGLPGEATVTRRIHDGRSMIVSEGDFGSVIRAWVRHSMLWDTPPDGLSAVMMRQGLAAAALHMANRPRDEQIAWTINIRQPPMNVFVAGESDRSAVTGRVITEGVKTSDSSRLYVQTRRRIGDPRESFLDVVGLDILGIFEQYYERSEQHPARFFELDAERFLMALALPGADRNWVLQLDQDAARALYNESRDLESRSIRFDCGCNPDKMMTALRHIFSGNPDELFAGDERVEASCPRCGRRWWVTRGQFLDEHEGDEKSGEAAAE